MLVRNMNVSKDIAEYVKGRANEVLTLDEIVADTGLSPEQARYAMRRLIDKSSMGKHIQVVTRGNTWEVGNIPGSSRRKKEEAEHNGFMFAPVGVLQDGTRVVRDEQGKLWKIIAL
ncbi:hypothetical protein SEA_YARA_79 [Streptomyces phage Yara]|nr:hypothetical protein SEA_YARA_79 [Streptomyces phage Yara]